MLAIRSNVRSTYESWLKTSNLPYDEIDDIFAEEELEKTISGQDGDKQNDPTEDQILPSRKMIYQILLMLKG